MRGRLWVCSNKEELRPLWDVWIYILGIRAECACWRAGGPDVPPLQERRREPVPSSAPSGGTFPPGGRLRKNKKGQVWNLSLKTQRRNTVSHKISLLPFFFKERKPRFRRTGAPGLFFQFRTACLSAAGVLDGGLGGHRYCVEIAMGSAATDSPAAHPPHIRYTLYHL